LDGIEINWNLDEYFKNIRNNRSMFDLILDEYGLDAVKLIQKLLPDSLKTDVE
jgi:hypothetical protein